MGYAARNNKIAQMAKKGRVKPLKRAKTRIQELKEQRLQKALDKMKPKEN